MVQRTFTKQRRAASASASRDDSFSPWGTFGRYGRDRYNCATMEGETDTDSSESENEEDMKRGVNGGIPYDVRRIG